MGNKPAKPINRPGFDSKTGAALAGLVVIIFIIAAMGVNILTAEDDADNDKWYCGYNKWRYEETTLGVTYSYTGRFKKWCDDYDYSKACKAKKAGDSWLSFMTFALVASLASMGLIFFKKSMAHLPLIGAGVFCLVAVVSWVSKNPLCWEYDGEDATAFDDAKMGISNILAVLGGVAGVGVGLFAQFM